MEQPMIPRGGPVRSSAIATLAGLLATLLISAPARAQLATRHHLAPLPGYSNAQLEVVVTTPATSPVAFRIFNKNDQLVSDGAAIASISDTVVRGSPKVYNFTRSTNAKDASGILSPTTSSSSQILDDYGIIVEADAAVSVVASELHVNNRSISTSKGHNGLGTEFYAWSNANYRTTANTTWVSSDNENSNFLSFIALDDATQITIDHVPAGVTLKGLTFTNGAATVTLNKYQTLTVLSDLNRSLSGTHVTGTKPFKMTSGDEHPYQQGSFGNRDGAADQLLPVDLAGSDFLIANFDTDNAYGQAGVDGVLLGNRYVQMIATDDDVNVKVYKSDGSVYYTVPTMNRGDAKALHLPGGRGTTYLFRARASNGTTKRGMLFFSNQSGSSGTEMGGTTVPPLTGKSSTGSFCSGTYYVELTQPADATNYLVYLPDPSLATFTVSVGSGTAKAWNDASLGATKIDFGGGSTGLPLYHTVRFPGTIATTGTRVAFESQGRMHVSVGTATGSTGSTGYFSDYSYKFQILDPVLKVPTDGYIEATTGGSFTQPRKVNHCLLIDSACSTTFKIDSLVTAHGITENLAPTLGPANLVCFNFTPQPIPGPGVQTYPVTVKVSDETGDTRSTEVRFRFTWSDDEQDAVPDAIDLDDDNDGILDSVELGGVDFSGDADLDGIADYEDASVQTCADANADGKCDVIPPLFDIDGDGVPNHLDLDSDGDGIFDLVEADDVDGDGVNDHGVTDLDHDGRIDTIIDANEDGLDDRYTTVAAAVQDSDGDGIADYLDGDDDGDGVLTKYEVSRNTDSDAHPDYLDTDDDGDGKLTRDELADPNHDGNPADARNSDAVAAPDYLEKGVPRLTGTVTWSATEGTTFVGQITSADDDGDVPTLALTGGPDADLFQFDPATGTLSFKQPPNFERPGDADGNNEYVIVITLSDGGQSTQQTVTITVGNVNDAPVLFPPMLSVDEGVTSVGKIVASDDDGDALTYSLVGGPDATRFQIAADGTLSLVAPADYENVGDANGDKLLEVLVQVSDGTSATTATAIVSVKNVPEAPTLTGLDAFAVFEGSTTVGTIAAQDSDGDPLTFTIVGGADMGAFVVDAVTGVLSFRQPPNYEQPADTDGDNHYDVIVAVSDGTFTAQQPIAVTISNVDEAPTFASTTTFDVAEGVTTVGAVTAHDDEGQPLTYAIVGGADASRFQITSDGTLTLVAPADYEDVGDANGDKVLEVVVQASDGAHTSTSTTLVAIKNVNEAPVLTGPASLTWFEGASTMLPVTARDPDGDTLTLTIVGGPDAALLTIVNGALAFVTPPSLASPADADKDNVYVVRVRVQDGGGLASEQDVAITVKAPDADGDGLSDAEEGKLGSNPNDADSDDDGVLDGDEVDAGKDSDGDGVINVLDPDSDNDGVFDGTELGKGCTGPGTDASKGHCRPDADPQTTTSPVNADTDGNGAKDGSEDSDGNGRVDAGETDPRVPGDDATVKDSDGDGLGDELEKHLGSDPADADSDDDGVLDGDEANPTDDTDGDGLVNVRDADSDGDGLFDGTERGLGCDNPATNAAAMACRPDADMGATKTSPLLPDSDGKGVWDGTEDRNGNGVVDAGETDPTRGDDDQPCAGDFACGGTSDGLVCGAGHGCVPGCRITEGCPAGQACTSATAAIGRCVAADQDGGVVDGGVGGTAGSPPVGGSAGHPAADAGAIGEPGIDSGVGVAPPGVVAIAGGGCSCEVGQRGATRGAWLLLAAAAILIVRRRRR